MENYLDSASGRIFNLVSESISGNNHFNYCDSIADLWILYLQENREIMVYLELLYVFFKIGLLGFGGGYAMISLIQFEVVDSFHWLTLQEFADILAISQMTPGPISINTATYVGYEVAGITGSVVATIALCLPSVMLMVLVMLFLFKNKENHWVQSLLKGLKPVMGGLILAAALLLMNKENFVDAGWGANNFSVIICAVSFIALYFFKINPMILITLAGICGAIIY